MKWKQYSIIAITIICISGCSLLSKSLSDIIPYSAITFAGEGVPLQGSASMNREKLDREVLLVQYNTAQYSLYHKRKNAYFPSIERALQEAGVPDDFKYLAVAESWLKNDAKSGVGALGIWQFMPETAKQQGLIVNDLVDERLNFEKSTHAAIAYLQRLQKRFDSWTLAAAAYNRGQTGLAKELQEQGVASYYDLFLNQETARYVYRIVAIKYISQFESEFFPNMNFGPSYSYNISRSARVNEIKNIIEYAKSQGCTFAQIRERNPWILGNSLPKGDWKIILCEHE